ncbi:MAG TPA: hypothetical protein VHO06_17795 [Polyangia bacterium]|nr:hypothetical protein [Polyangia bacterium]
MRRLVVGLCLVAAGCLAPADPSVTQVEEAVGEPMNGFPSALERLGLMAINRARSDPETVKGASSASYPARPPVIWSLALNKSARFHATNLELGDVTLMHSSPCTLNTDVGTSGCTGDPSCACATPIPSTCAMCAQVAAENSCGTDPFVRIGYFTSGSGISANGEVAAAGYPDPIATVDGWMDEAAGADGHRMNLTDQGITSNTMGYGHATGTKECFSPFDVSDSGNMKNASIPKLPTAAVSPASGAAGSFTFYATWNDPTLGAPAAIDVVIDGACTPMTRELGNDKLNATYKATATLAAGCHTYYISAQDAGGAAVTYPTNGAYDIPVGSASCSADYVATAPASSCSSGTTGSAGASGTGGASATGTGGSPGSGGTTGAAGATGAGGTTGAGGDRNGDTSGSSGCSCDAGAARPPAAAGALLLLALLSLRARRAPAPHRARRRRP